MSSSQAVLTDKLIAALAAIDSPTLANALELSKRYPRIGHYVGYDIKTWYPDLPSSIGFAVTCRGDSTTEGRTKERGLQTLWEVLARAPKPAIVVIQDDGRDRLHSCHCGEVMGTTMKRLGAVALLTDGGVRDIHEVRALGGFQFFAPGLVVAHGNPLIYDIGVDVEISGVKIKQGDLLHGDANGLLRIPVEAAAELPAAVKLIRDRESATLQRVKSADFSPFAAPGGTDH